VHCSIVICCVKGKLWLPREPCNTRWWFMLVLVIIITIEVCNRDRVEKVMEEGV
jgi:hypothetical protein